MDNDNEDHNISCEAKYEWRVVLLVTVVSVMIYGSPDLLDGIIHFLHGRQCTGL